MKTIIFILLFQSYIYSITMSMENNLTNSFSQLKDLNITITKSTQESLNNIKENITDFAIVRGDLLYLSFKGDPYFAFTNYYLISKLQIFNYLYFIGRERSNIRYITDLRNKKISIGELGDLGNYYLKQILNKIDHIDYKVHFYSESVDKSLEKISSKELDFLFAFSKKRLKENISKYFLKNIYLESRFKNILLKNLGLQDGEHIQAQYYLISSSKITNTQLINLIEYMQKNNLLNTKISPKYGLINPLITELLIQLKQLIKTKEEEKIEELKKQVLYKELLILKESAITKIVIIRNELNKFKRAVQFLSKYSQKLIFSEKINEVVNIIGNNRKLLDSIVKDAILKDKSIINIKLKISEISEIINQYRLLLDSVKSNIVDIKIILAKEKE